MNLERHFKLALLLLTGTLFVSCSYQDSKLKIESNTNAVGLLTTIKLNPDTTVVQVQDYFLIPELIDSVSYDAGEVSLAEDKHSLVFTGEVPSQLSVLRAHSGDTTYSILVKKSSKLKTSFKLNDPEHKFSAVEVYGDFNEWNPQYGVMTYNKGEWETIFNLAPGRYQYTFRVDGHPKIDPLNTDSIDNNYGGFNSVKWVESSSEQYPELRTVNHTGSSIILAAQNTTDIIVQWQNQALDLSYFKLAGDKIEIIIPSIASKLKRSFIRVNGMNADNTSNNILIPLEYGKVIRSAEKLNRTDWHANSLYFMMVDRFNNADTSNDGTMNVPEIDPRADYYGGDIKGVTEKIKSGYFKDLGINSIWLSPIVQNPEGAYGLYPEPKTKFSAYHGYWPSSFSKVDYRFGTPAELKEMVQLAHDNDFNVLIDFVANHVHEEHWVYKEHPDWATELYLPDGTMNTEKWDEYRLTTWFDTHLPTLDLTNPVLTDMLTDSAVFWMNEYGIDGFRHDATKHVPEYFWRELTKKLKKQVILPNNKAIYQIGETYGSRELIASYVSSGQMDAQFDFGVYDDALPTFARDDVSFSRLQGSINESMKYYGNHHLMGNVTGNQDKARFMAFASGDLDFGEDHKYAGWTREIKVSDPIGYEKLKLFHAFNMTIPGIPVIYYGDEIGMTGANDPDNRRMMRFDLENPEEIDVRGTVSRLAKLRKANLELSYGDLTWLHVDENSMVFTRTYFDDISIIAFNKNSEEAIIQIELPERFKKTELEDLTKTSIENLAGYVTMNLQPHSFTIIQSK